MYSALKLFFLSSLLGLAAFVFAELDVSSSNNVAIYWGQNSYNQGSGQYAQQRLGYYCSNTEIDVIQLAFLVSISNPELNFANAGNNCTLFPGSNLFSCPQLEEDITTCQTTYGKTILLSIGGATYSEGGFSSSSAAITAANNLWAIFGPPNTASANRPFGSSTIDGFDFDFESGVSNMVPFANQLRSLMDANTAQTGKKWFLTAAPQCPYPDAADNSMLNGQVFFDAIWVQFYNNYCGVQSYVAGASTQNNFNFGTWDTWAKTVSKNPAVKVLLGVPGSPTAAGSGYESASALAPVISYSKSFSSFGGVMAWDMSQIYANSGFLDGVCSDLGGAGTPPPPKSSTTKSSTTVAPTSTFKTVTTSRAATSTFKTITTSRTTTTSSANTTTTAAGSGTVGQWGQCGGIGYTGPTGCVSPYTCVENSVWWSQCQ